MPGDRVYTLNDYYFELPEELIAQYPAGERINARLFVLDRREPGYKHRVFYEIGEFFCKGDVLVINNARVIPARIFFKRKSGGLVEIVLTRRLSGDHWDVISNRTKKLMAGDILYSEIDPSIEIIIREKNDDILRIESNRELTDEVLKVIGAIPLPPYIKREPIELDNKRYQTVYAKAGTAAAAPTAGLHFTDDLIGDLKDKGIIFTELTLDVSWGTFQPVRNEDLSKHRMHSENFYLSSESAEIINKARKDKRRVIAVGTTSLRVLESTFIDGKNSPGIDKTDIFIYPPYQVNSIDALITNFHTPYSTLLMLVSAFAGYERIMNAYKAAVHEKYRFFSYGDCMLIL